jgi:NAD(P)-dependent dehydrogenase (short-subunit alcohol dehydrogenase family)
MRERNFGHIINIFSINGQRGQLGIANYCAAKACVLGSTKAVTLENARKNVTVKAIAPGYINTEMPRSCRRRFWRRTSSPISPGPSLASLCIGGGMGVAMAVER